MTRRGWIRLSWGTEVDNVTHGHYVVVVPVEQTVESAAREAQERLLSLLAHDHIDSQTQCKAGVIPHA